VRVQAQEAVTVVEIKSVQERVLGNQLIIKQAIPLKNVHLAKGQPASERIARNRLRMNRERGVGQIHRRKESVLLRSRGNEEEISLIRRRFVITAV